MVEKVRPIATIHESYGEDGRGPKNETVEFYCPTCGRYIGSWKKDTACDKCGTFYDWGNKEPSIKTIKSIEWGL